MTVTDRLFALADEKYADFQSKLTPTVARQSFIGVRVPAVRKLAKEIYRSGQYADFLKALPHKYYDENMLHGLILAECKEYDCCISLVDDFLPYVDNWAVCDIMSPKVFKKHKEQLLGKIREWTASGKTYTVRFGIEMLMSHYLDEDFKPAYLEIPAGVRSGDYYVNMMVAWFFATALTKQWDAAIPYIEGNRLETWTHNKTIQKAVESYRITDAQKKYLRTLKRQAIQEKSMTHKYFEINEGSHNIRCKLYTGERGQINKMILFVHGFAGHKDNKTAENFAERVLSGHKDAAVLVFDLPCHGEDVKKKLTLGNCMAYLETVTAYIKETFGIDKADACAVSFGGYLVLRYISERGNPFRRIVLRCPAVNLYESMTGTIMTEEDLRKLEKGKKAAVGFDRKVELDRTFLEELRENDIRKSDFIDFADDLFILHGTADEIIPFPEVSAFADRNCIELLPIPGADHRFSNPLLLEQTTKAILRFFGLE